MSLALSSLIVLGLLVLFLGAGVWIFAGLTLVGAVALNVILDYSLINLLRNQKKELQVHSKVWDLIFL